MDAEVLYNEVNERVLRDNHVSLAECARHWPAEFHGGEFCISLANKPGIILWVGMSETGSAVLQRFMTEQRVKPASMLTYLIDGHMLRMPLVKRDTNYKKPHWLPIVLMRDSQPKPRKRKTKAA